MTKNQFPKSFGTAESREHPSPHRHLIVIPSRILLSKRQLATFSDSARESDDYHRCEKWWIAIAWVVLGHTIVNHRPIAWHCSQRHISNLSHAFMTRRFERKWPVEKLGKEMSYISEFSSQLNKNAIWRHLGENTDITQSYCRLPHGTGLLPNIFALNRNPAPI